MKIKQDKTLGYMYFMDKDNPQANKQGRVYLHRHVMSEYLGRRLESHEHVHHKNHDRSDNRIENLELTTASEHAQKHTEERGGSRKQEVDCPVCGAKFLQRWTDQVCCSKSCAARLSGKRLFNPPKEELEELVWKISCRQLGKHYGVSDKAVEKRCKLLGIKKPPRGYWAKQRSNKETA